MGFSGIVVVGRGYCARVLMLTIYIYTAFVIHRQGLLFKVYTIFTAVYFKTIPEVQMHVLSVIYVIIVNTQQCP